MPSLNSNTVAGLKVGVRPNGNDKPTLTADAWASAALDAIARSGLQGVAVEPLARHLGVTKGSFYWHFANREALLERTLQLWEKQETDEVLNHAEQAASPHERVQRLIAEVNGSRRPHDRRLCTPRFRTPAKIFARFVRWVGLKPSRCARMGIAYLLGFSWNITNTPRHSRRMADSEPTRF